MKVTVRETNIIDNTVVDEHDFGTKQEAVEYAVSMNELFKNTNLVFKIHNKQ